MGFRVSGFGVRVSGIISLASGNRFGVWGVWCRVSRARISSIGSRFRVEGFEGHGFRVQGLGFRVQGLTGTTPECWRG